MNEMGNQGTTEQMTTTGYIFAPSREFTVGGAISRAFSMMRTNPLVFCGFTLSFFLPALLARALIKDPVISKLFSAILNMTLLQIMQGAMAHASYQILCDRRASFGESLNHGTRRLFAMIAISWLTGLGITLGVLILVGVPVWFLGRFGLFVGAILMLTVGTTIFCSIPVMIPACVVEGLGPLDSINRGAALTKGYRWKIFALYLFLLIGIVVALPLSGLIARLIPLGGIVRLIVMGLLLVLPLTFCFIMGPVIYYGLREAKEGVSVENLSNVFD